MNQSNEQIHNVKELDGTELPYTLLWNLGMHTCLYINVFSYPESL